MPKMSQASTGSATSPDVYPTVRVSTEFFLRGFDLLRQLHDDVLGGLVIMTLWHDALSRPGRKAMGIRELARKLDLPYETVRRHVTGLVTSGLCLVENGGLAVPSARRSNAGILRKIYVNAVRLLGDLSRIDVVDFKADRTPPDRARRLDRDQMAIAVAAMGLLLAGMRVLRGFFDGDLIKGLVFTGIWAANVKHVTNSAPAAHRSILPDHYRLPVSARAISDSLRLPYETVRRHADALVKEGRCARVGRQGLMVPESVHRSMTEGAVTVSQFIMAFLAELRVAGVKL